MKKIIKAIISLAAIVTIILLFTLIMSASNLVTFILFGLIGFALIGMAILNFIFYKRLNLSDTDQLEKKLKDKYFNEMTYDEIYQRHFQIHRQIDNFFSIIDGLMAILLVLIIRTSLEFGALYLILLVIPAYFTGTIMPTDKNHKMYRQPHYLREDCSLIIYQILDEIKQEFKIVETIKLYVNYSNNVSVFSNHNSYGIVVGATLLVLLNKEELKSILYHEVGHIINGDTKQAREVSLTIIRLFLILDNVFLKLTSLLTSSVCRYYATELSVNCLALSIEQERRADLVVKQANLAKAYISSELKMKYWDLFVYFYETEHEIAVLPKASKTIIEDSLKEFLDNLAKNKERYDYIIANELEIRDCTHPTVRARMEFMEIDSYDYMGFDCYDEDEVSKIIAIVNRHINDEEKYQKTNYTYLKNVDIIFRYEKTMVVDESKMIDYGRALCAIGELEKGYQAFEKALTYFPNNPWAIMGLGQLKLLLYSDVSGIDDIIKVVASRYTFTQPLSLACTFMALLGLKDMYYEYCELLDELTEFNDQNDEDYDYIDSETLLEPLTLDYQLQTKIVDILKASCFELLFVVRKWIDKRYIDLICISYDEDSIMVEDTIDKLQDLLENQLTEYDIHIIDEDSIDIICEISKPVYIIDQLEN